MKKKRTKKKGLPKLNPANNIRDTLDSLIIESWEQIVKKPKKLTKNQKIRKEGYDEGYQKGLEYGKTRGRELMKDEIKDLLGIRENNCDCDY